MCGGSGALYSRPTSNICLKSCDKTKIEMSYSSTSFSCPFDYIKVYDGETNEDDVEVIGLYCGRLTDITIYSTSAALHIEFVTKSGRVAPTKKLYVPYWERQQEYDSQRRGFRAEFEISEKFVNLGA